MKYFLLANFIFFSFFATAQNENTVTRYTKVPAGYLVVLRQGESLFEMLEMLAIKEKIPAANITGMGFLGEVRFGFFNAATKEFDPKDFTNVELASLSGTIAWEQGKPSLHLHGVIGDKYMNAYAGHLLSGVVGTGSLEIFIQLHDKMLDRKMDPSIGAKILQLSHH